MPPVWAPGWVEVPPDRREEPEVQRGPLYPGGEHHREVQMIVQRHRHAVLPFLLIRFSYVGKGMR